MRRQSRRARTTATEKPHRPIAPVPACKTPLDRDERVRHETTVKRYTVGRRRTEVYGTPHADRRSGKRNAALNPSSPNAPYQLGTVCGGPLPWRSGPTHPSHRKQARKRQNQPTQLGHHSESTLVWPFQRSHTELAFWSLSIQLVINPLRDRAWWDEIRRKRRLRLTTVLHASIRSSPW